MAKYTFQLACPKDTYTIIAENVDEITVEFSVYGRLILQDAADMAPADNVSSGFMPTKPDKEYNLSLDGLEAYWMPWGYAGTVSGVKR